MKIRDANILIIPGFKGADEDHWQSRWEAKMPNATRVNQAEFNKPVCEDWKQEIEKAILASDKPAVLVAHSLGVAAAVHVLNENDDVKKKVVGAFFVSPPDVANTKIRPKHLMTFGPYPTGPMPCPTFVIGSSNDSFSDQKRMQETAADWGAFFVDAGESGHINGETGHGPWPEGLMVFAEFMKRL